MFELSHLDYPGERLIACRNDQLARRRAHKRENLLKASVEALNKVRRMVERGRLCGEKEIDERVRSVLS